MGDETNHILNEIDISTRSDNKIISHGLKRIVIVSFDSVQYSIDVGKNTQDLNLYDTFQLLVKRDVKKNNFRTVIETILDLLTDNYSLPHWLHDLFLGFGNLSKNQSKSMIKQSLNLEVDMFDTFLDEKHSREIMNKKTKVKFFNFSKSKDICSPLRIKFIDLSSSLNSFKDTINTIQKPSHYLDPLKNKPMIQT